MGNRAVLTFSTLPQAPAIYLHWNGGRASVEAFLDAARDLGCRKVQPNTVAAQERVMDYLAMIIARHFFGNDVGLSVYRTTFGRSDADNYDNGTYLLNDALRITERLHKRRFDENDPAKTQAIYEQIISTAPAFTG